MRSGDHTHCTLVPMIDRFVITLYHEASSQHTLSKYKRAADFLGESEENVNAPAFQRTSKVQEIVDIVSKVRAIDIRFKLPLL